MNSFLLHFCHSFFDFLLSCVLFFFHIPPLVTHRERVSHTTLAPYLFSINHPPIHHVFSIFFSRHFHSTFTFHPFPPLTLGLINVTPSTPSLDPDSLPSGLGRWCSGSAHAAARLRLPCTCLEVSFIQVFWSFSSISEFQLHRELQSCRLEDKEKQENN